MTSNRGLQPTQERGWLSGYHNLVAKENRHWWKTSQWWTQILIWAAIVNGMLAMLMLIVPQMDAEAEAIALPEALEIFFVFVALAPAVGVVLIGQEAIVEEKQMGTAAWVLSKPVSRSAFILSKFIADALGVLVTMVLAQGLIAYLILYLATGEFLPPMGFIAALALVYLVLLFYLTLTLLLGTLFDSRGPVIGIPMGLVFGYQLILGMAPWLANVLPWNLTMTVGPDRPSLAATLAQGRPLPTLGPIIGTLALSVLFIAVAIWRFNQEEF